jgi:hypothetical protein
MLVDDMKKVLGGTYKKKTLSERLSQVLAEATPAHRQALVMAIDACVHQCEESGFTVAGGQFLVSRQQQPLALEVFSVGPVPDNDVGIWSVYGSTNGVHELEPRDHWPSNMASEIAIGLIRWADALPTRA